MHQDLIRQLDEAVAEVFAVVLNLACSSERDCRCVGNNANSPPTFNASVLFSGPLEGRCCLELDQHTAAQFTSNLMGMSPSEISPDLCADTAGELCNMIAGSWKRRHTKDLAASKLSCPIVTLGQCLQAIDSFREATTLLYHFDGHCLTLRLAFN